MKTKVGMFLSGLVLLSPSAWAAFSIDELQQATKIAVEAFQAANPAHVEHFVGFKSWKSGEEAKVKVYVSHDGMNMEYNYVCHKHESAMECHAQ